MSIWKSIKGMFGTSKKEESTSHKEPVVVPVKVVSKEKKLKVKKDTKVKKSTKK